ncbi:MAG: DUF11 domain-containing protein [Lachnospiraceae bacterium]|nr:DUF11 domain-containing protein [Lachnospiraceae bacterium]
MMKKFKQNMKKWLVYALCTIMVLEPLGGYLPGIIGIKDAYAAPTPQDLTTYITGVQIMNTDCTVNWAGNVDQDGDIGVRLNFTLPGRESGFNLTDNSVFKYDLSAVMTDPSSAGGEGALDLSTIAQNNAGKMTGPINSDVTGQQVGTYTIEEDGTVLLDFSYAVDNNLLDSVYAMAGHFQFSCGLNEDAFGEDEGTYTLVFTHDDEIDPEITVNAADVVERNITAAKSAGVVDLNAGTITYTVTVTNTGTADADNITIKDTQGYNLTYNESASAAVLGSGITATKIDDHNVEFAIPPLGAGASTTITYVCDIANSVLNGANWGLENTISATVTEDGVDKNITITDDGKTSQTVYNSISKDIVGKSGKLNDDGTITWTITVNGGTDSYHVNGLVLSDVLSGVEQQITGPITIKNNKTNAEEAISAGPDGFTYTFTKDSEDSYTITYTTSVTGEVVGTQVAKNTITVTKDGETLAEETAPVTLTNSFLKKAATRYENSKGTVGTTEVTELVNGNITVDWEASFRVPNTVDDDANNIPAVTYKDQFANNIDDYVLDAVNQAAVTVSVDGTLLVKGTDYTISTWGGNGAGWGNFTIEFKKDAATMAKIAGGNVTVTYQTVGGMDGEAQKIFQNNASVNIGDISDSVSASQTVEYSLPEEYMSKTALTSGVIDGNYTIGDKEHMITWELGINTGNGITAKNWEKVVITDTVSNMDFYGYKDLQGGTKDWPDSVYICANGWVTMRLDTTNGGVTYTTSESAPDAYETKITFDLSKAIPVEAWSNPDNLATIPENCSVVIRYTTVVPDDKIPTYSTTTNYSNHAEFTGTDIDTRSELTSDVEDEASLNNRVITKEKNDDYDGDNRQLEYNITVNPDGIQLSRNGSGYQVIDELPDDLIYVADSLVVTDENGMTLSADKTVDGVVTANTYEVSLDDENNDLIVFLPDNKALTLTYRVYMLSGVGVNKNYVNSAIIPAPFVENQSSVQNRESHTVAASTAGIDGRVLFQVEKVDANVPTERLEGAIFRATEYEYNSDSGTWAASGNVFEATTGVSGKVDSYNHFTVAEGEQDAKISVNKYYEIEEYYAPLGYATSSKTYKIIVLGEDSSQWPANIPSDVYSVSAGIVYLFSDVPQNSLVFEKKYMSSDGMTENEVLSGADAAEIHIYYGKYTWEQCENNVPTKEITESDTTVSFTKIIDGTQNTYELRNLPAGDYTVYESKAGTGYDKLDDVIHFTVDATGAISWDGEAAAKVVEQEIENIQTVVIDNIFTINKTYLDIDDNELVTVPEKAIFYIQQTKDKDGSAMSGTKVEIPSTDDAGKEYIVEDLEPGTYEITEKSSNLYGAVSALPITLVVDATGTITATAKDGSVTVTDSGTTDVAADVKNKMNNPFNEIVLNKTYVNPIGVQYTDDGAISGYMGATTFKLYKYDGANYAEDPTAINLVLNSGVGATARLENLEPGEYYIEETAQPDSFFKASNIYFTVHTDYSITYDGTTDVAHTVDVVNREYSENAYRVNIEKNYYDQDGSVVSLASPATTFVYGWDRNLVDQITQDNYTSQSYVNDVINEDTDLKKVTLPAEGIGNLPEGTYYFKEVDNVDGYDLMNGIITIVIEPTGVKSVSYDGTDGAYVDAETTYETDSVTIVARNYAQDNKLTLTKQYFQADGTVIDASSLGNDVATFVLSRKDSESAANNTYADVSNKLKSVDNSGEDGIYVFEGLNPGYYRLRENVPDGYETVADIFFTVNEAYEISAVSPASFGGTATDATCLVDNIRLSNSLAITKKTVDYGGTVSTENATGLTFTIRGTDADNSSYSAVLSEMNGVYSIGNLPDGNYKIEETVAPGGYVAAQDILVRVTDATIYLMYTGTDGNLNVDSGNGTTAVAATLLNRAKTNRIILNKEYYNADGTELELNEVIQKAVFEIYKVDGGRTLYKTMTAASNGALYTATELEPGDYVIVETVPAGYEAVAEIQFRVNADYSITLGAGANSYAVETTVRNTRTSSSFTLIKNYYDAGGKPVMTDDIINATTFKAYFEGSTTPIDVNYSQSAGGFYINNLREGTYLIKETVAPEGYVRAGDIRLVVGSDGKVTATYLGSDGAFTALNNNQANASARLTNYAYTNSIEITKIYKDGTTEIAYANVAKKAQFKLYMDYGTARQQDVSAKVDAANAANGKYLITALSAGLYTLVEQAPGGYVAAQNIVFEVGNDNSITIISGATAGGDDLNLTIEVENQKRHNQITLNKQYVDENGATVALNTLAKYAQFKLYKISGSNEVEVAGKIDASKASQGIYVLTDLEQGSYKLKETAPDKYKAAADIVFTVDADWNIRFSSSSDSNVTLSAGNDTDQTATVINQEFSNQITIEKTYYDYNGQLMSPADVETYAVFKLYKLVNGAETEVAGRVDAANAATGKYVIKDLTPGDYLIRETKADGYHTVSDVTFTVDQNWLVTFDTNTDTAITVPAGTNKEQTLQVANYSINGLRIRKTFYDTTGNPIDGTAVFRLWNVDNGVINGADVVTDDTDPGYNITLNTTNTFVTESKGVYVVRDLAEGKYAITEEANAVYKTPYAGWYLYFEVDADGKLSKVESFHDDVNEPMWDGVTYLDTAGGNESLMAEVALKNYRSIDVNYLRVDKRFYNADGQDVTTDALLGKTEFALKDNGGNEIALTYDGATKKFVVVDVPEGTYALAETKTPEGYVTAAAITVTVAADRTMTISYTGDIADCKIEGSGSLDGMVTLINRAEKRPESVDPPKTEQPASNPQAPAPPTAVGGIQTGDHTPLMAMILVAISALILGLGCIGLYIKRRKQ